MSGERVSVWLVGFQPEARADAVQGLVDAFGIDQRAAQSLVERMPAPVKRTATHEQAAHYTEALRAIGGEVSIRSPMFAATLDGPRAEAAAASVAIDERGAAPSLAPPVGTRTAGGGAAAAPDLVDIRPKTRVRHGQVCVEHPEAVAAFYCTNCDLSRCSDCVSYTTTGTSAGAAARCRRCQQPAEKYVEPFAVMTAVDYLSELPRSLLFFARKDVLFLLIATAIIVWPISAMAAMPGNLYRIIGLAIQFAFESALLLHLIRQVARDESDIGPPDFSDIYDDLINPTWRYLFACLPMIAAVLWTASIALDNVLNVADVAPWDAINFHGPALLFVGGFVIWPITSLIAAMSASILSVLNPIEWIKAIRSIGTPLLAGAPLFYAFVLFEAFVVIEIAESLLEITVIGRLLALILSYLALAVRARLLGSMIIGRL